MPKKNSQVGQKAYLEVKSGLIYIAVHSGEGLVFITYIDEGFQAAGIEITEDYFHRLVAKGLWLELDRYKSSKSIFV